VSLQTRLAALISAIGTDIKTLQTRVPPAGGTIGQILSKKTNTDYDTQWIAQLIGLNWQGAWSSGSIYQMDNVVSFQSGLYRANINTAIGQSPLSHPEYWSTMVAPELPVGGTTAQILSKRTATNYDVQWSNPTGGAGLPEIYIGDAQPSRNAEVLWMDTDEAAPATLNITMDTWHMVASAGEPVFVNNWVNYDLTTYNGAGFRKSPDGRVVLKGFVKAGTSSVMFTLPVGYRPPKDIIWTGTAHNGTSYVPVDGRVYSTGGVAIVNPPASATVWVSLESVEFDTESVLQIASVAAQPLDTWHQVGDPGEPTFQGAWKNFDNAATVPSTNPAHRNLRFRKYPDGRVRIVGVPYGGTSGSIVFTLPVGYRVARTDTTQICYASGGIATFAIVGGNVSLASVVGNVNTWAYIDNEFDSETISAYTSGVIGPQRVTVLPVGAVDGQEVYYVADATNGVIWHLRYNAASASAYKWELVGGTPLNSQSELEGSIVSTTAAVTTGEPNLTVPLAGDYRITASVSVELRSANGWAWNYIQAGVGNAIYMSLVRGAATSGVRFNGATTRTVNAPALAVGAVCTMLHASDGSNPAYFLGRSINLIPVRVG